jgi:hypothetical protein
MTPTPAEITANRIVAYVERGWFSDGLTAGNVYGQHWVEMPSMETVQTALSLLVERGFLTKTILPGGDPPRVEYAKNPEDKR